MSLFVPSHFGQKGGTFNHYRDETGGMFGTDGSGNPYERRYGYSFRDGYQTKTHVLTPGRGPKEYVRFHAKIIDITPLTWREYGYSDHYDIQYQGWPDGEPLEPQLGEEGNIVNNCEAASITKALNKLRNGERMQVAVDLLEAPKTLNMAGSAAISLVKAYKEARRLNWRQVVNHLGVNGHRFRNPSDELAKRWLELQYGWLPLMGTIDSGLKKVNEEVRAKGALFSAKGVSIEKGSINQDTVDRERTVDYEILVKTEYYYRVKSALIDQLDTFGLLNPLSVAWELVPFSFVVDWFVPVGNTLSALTARAGLEFDSGYRTYVSKKTLMSWGVDNGQRGPHWQMTSNGKYHSESLHVRRYPIGNFEFPQFYANYHPFSTKRIANAVALIRSLF